MNINNVENISVNSNSYVQKNQNVVSSAKAAVSEKSAESADGRYDTYEKSDNQLKSEDTGIYSKESIKEQLKAAEEQRQQAFKNFISSMVTDQIGESNFSLLGFDLKVTEADSQKALEAISDGGEYSIDSVATRIMDMAEALSGGDQTKLSLLRQAVTDGFSDAAKKLGLKDDDMPEITKKTYTEVMNRFDKWENSFKETDNKDEKSSDETDKTNNVSKSA